MQKYFFVALICCLANDIVGQKLIYGTVSDSTTSRKLSSVNVYINNSTIGTTTDQNGNYSLTIPKGHFEIVYSFVGFRSYKIETATSNNDRVQIDVKLAPVAQELESVVIQGSTDKEWKKLIREFKEIFLGKTRFASNCSIFNAPYIDVEINRIAGKRVLSARASRPIEIQNDVLGYKIFYDLHEFSSSKAELRYSGNVYFVALEPKDAEQSALWARNRLNVYSGSSAHLFRSILTHQLKKEGFTLYANEKLSNSLASARSFEPANITSDPDNGVYRIEMPRDIQVQYVKSDDPGKTRISRLIFSKGYVEVDSLGVVLDPLSVISAGYLGAYRVSSLLPADYQPDGNASSQAPLLSTSFNLGGDYSIVTADGKDISEDMLLPSKLDSLEQRTIQYLDSRPTEKVYLQFDKPFYFIGEDSWYKAYVLRSTDLNATNISSVLYIDWIDPFGKIAEHQQLKITDGSATADFQIRGELKEGYYTVRAYTNWMRNEDPSLFYSTTVPVYNLNKGISAVAERKKRNIDLQFFPEGGTLVANTMTQIAFKAIDDHGASIDVRGEIRDEKDIVVANFKSVHNGMGLFPLISPPNKSFRAVLETGEVYRLPIAVATGTSLAASNINYNRLLVRVQTTAEVDSSFYLVGISRGLLCYSEYLSLHDGVKNIAISKDALPEGLLQFTLFNKHGVPLCVRMVFIRKRSQAKTTITSVNSTFAPRDSVTLMVSVKDDDGNPVQTPLCVSVNDANFVQKDQRPENIYTRLLLQSEIKGHVESPAWYFSSENAQTTYALDLVMLTHGWSRYNWAQINNTSTLPRFNPEEGITLEGQISIRDKPLVNAPFMVVVPNSDVNRVTVVESDSTGSFHVGGLNFPDSTESLWKVIKKNGVVSNVKVHLKKGGQMPAPESWISMDDFELTKKALFDRISQPGALGAWSLGTAKLLEEVTIKGDRIVVRSNGHGGIIVKPRPEDLKLPTSQYVSRFAGKLPFYSPTTLSDGTMVWYGAVISINGWVADNVGEGGSPMIVLNTVPIEDIDNVQVYGNAHDGYFIQISTTKNTSQPRTGLRKIIYGYTSPREFYHPKYGPDDATSTLPDTRITLYWNANLQTDKEGKAILKFYNNDSTEKFMINVEGVSDGHLISKSVVIGGN